MSPGPLVDPGCPRSSVRPLGALFSTVAPRMVQSRPGCWSKPWALRHGPESPESLVEHADPPTRSRVSREGGQHRGHRTLARVSRDIWLIPRALGPRPKWPVIAGRPRGPSESGTSHQRHRVDLAGPGTRAQVAWDCCSTPRALGHKWELPERAGRPRGASDPGPSRMRHLVDTTGHRAWPKSLGTAGRPLRPSDMDPNPLGHLVEPVGSWTQAQVARDSC